MTFGTAFVLRTRHKQTLPATRKAKTMFFQAKKNSRKTTRQTLSTEQLEPKAMFNAAPLQAELGFEDRLSGDYDVNDAVLQVRSSQNVTCNTGFSGGGNHICNADSIWTTGGASTLRIAGTAGPGGSTYLRSDNRFVFETPKDDNGISLHASANPHAGPEGFMKLGDIKGEFRQTLSIGSTAGPGGSRFMTDTGGRSIVHPSFNVGNDGRSIVHPSFNVVNNGRSIVHPSFNVGNDGRSIVHPSFNVGNDSHSIVHPSFNVGEDGRMIVHPSFNVGLDGLSTSKPTTTLDGYP